MKKLVSILILVILVVLGLWAGSAYWFGVKAEQEYRVLLHQASQSQYVKLVNESYQRGWYQSHAKTVIEVQLSSGLTGETQSFKVPLIQDIAHGPFPLDTLPEKQWQWKPAIAVIETRLAPGSELQSRFAELWTQVPELAAVRDFTIIYLDGSGEERLTIPAFQRTFGSEEPVAVTWKGLSFQANFTATLKAISGSLSVPGAELRGKGVSLRLGEAKADFVTSEGISGLWLGDASCSLATLDLSAEQETAPQSLLLQGFSAKTTTKAAGDNLNSQIAFRTELVKVDGTQYGPGVFEMELRNLDAPSLARLQQSLGDKPAQSGQSSEEALQMKTLALYMEILPGLLKKSPELEIQQFDLKTSLGDFTGKARLAFDGTKAGSVQNLMALTTALTVQADLKIAEGLLREVLAGVLAGDIVAEWEELEGEPPDDEEVQELVAERVEEQLATLSAQHILVKEDGFYATSARYEGGQIVLNGRPLSLQDLVP